MSAMRKHKFGKTIFYLCPWLQPKWRWPGFRCHARLPLLRYSRGNLRAELSFPFPIFNRLTRGLVFLGLLAAPVLNSVGRETLSAEKKESTDRVGKKSDSSAGSENISFSEKKLLAIVEKQETLLGRYAVKKELSEFDLEDLRFRARNIVQEYESLIAEAPDQLLPYILFGKFLNQIGQEEHAAKMFLRADTIDPNVAVIKQQLGNYLAETGKFEEAMGFFIQAIYISPNTALYHYQLAELFSTYKENFINEKVLFRDVLENEMMQAFSDADRLEPGNVDFKMRYAESIYDLKNPDWQLALQLWDDLRDMGHTSLHKEAVNLHRARVLSKLGRLKEARDLAQSVDDPVLEFSRNQLLEELEQLPTEAETAEQPVALKAIPAPTNK